MGGFSLEGGLLKGLPGGGLGVSLVWGVSLVGGSPWGVSLAGGGVSLAGGLPGRDFPGRGVSLVGGWGLPGVGVSLVGSLPDRGSPWWGVSLVGVSPWQGGLPGRPLPVNRMTDTCENITLPQTSFAGGKKFKHE